MIFGHEGGFETAPWVVICPECGSESGIHLQSVMMAGRKEDGEFTCTMIDRLGAVYSVDDVPVGAQVGEGRRHRIVINGWCENDHFFALILTQHKGTTFAELVVGEAETEPRPWS